MRRTVSFVSLACACSVLICGVDGQSVSPVSKKDFTEAKPASQDSATAKAAGGNDVFDFEGDALEARRRAGGARRSERFRWTAALSIRDGTRFESSLKWRVIGLFLRLRKRCLWTLQAAALSGVGF